MTLRPLACALFASLFLAGIAAGQTITVDARPSHSTNSFIPDRALGAGIDRLPYGAPAKVFVSATVKKLLTAGWGPVTYRQNTELMVQAWHWNPNGSWSNPAKQDGYFTGSTKLGAPILDSWGYSLPERGVTRDNGTVRGYSRLTDGNPQTYWKSNPYLTHLFTHQPDAAHPQWVMLDLKNIEPVDAIQIAWANPYATEFRVQYWVGAMTMPHPSRMAAAPMNQPAKGSWISFPHGIARGARGGDAILRLADKPLRVRYIRIWMTASSNTCDSHGAGDPRNCVGYAIRQISLGTVTENGLFHDLIRHVPDPDQTPTYASSTDPWHRASDLFKRGGDQVGFDRFFTSGITRGLPAIIPIAIIYSTPQDSANEIRYIEERGYKIGYVEMGEEPDGHFFSPEDYGELFDQWAVALHRVDPKLKLGGPIFTGSDTDIRTWPNELGQTSWTRRFIDYIRAHGHLKDLAFFSYEHYPFKPCTIEWNNLYQEPRLVTHMLHVWRQDGVPKNVPLFITESNLSWSDEESFEDIWGGLWLADYIGAFLAGGGNGVYYFHYIPLGIHPGCDGSPGTFSLFSTGANLAPEQPLSQYFASRLINLDWVEPGDGVQRVFPARSDIEDGAGDVLVTSYAVLRPDGQWSLMIINKDQENAYRVRIRFRERGGSWAHFSGPVARTTFGPKQYAWRPLLGKYGEASPDGPEAHSELTAGAGSRFELPAASITVLRGKIAPR